MTNAVDLSKLPAPDIIQTISFESILSEITLSFSQQFPSYSALLESDPVVKLLEVFAYREVILRQKINDASRANMLAYAKGSDLDNLAALFNVSRAILVEADPTAIPPVEAIYEDDQRFLRRISLAMEGFSTAGPAGAYQYHTYQADSGVKDVHVYSPQAGEVHVVPLSDNLEKNGLPDVEQLQRIHLSLNEEDVRPLTDKVSVKPPQIIPFQVHAKIAVNRGPGNEWSSQQALVKLESYLEDQIKLGTKITQSAIIAALHQPGVNDIELISPPTNIQLTPEQCPILSPDDPRTPAYPIISENKDNPYEGESRAPYVQGKIQITQQGSDYIITTIPRENQ